MGLFYRLIFFRFLSVYGYIKLFALCILLCLLPSSVAAFCYLFARSCFPRLTSACSKPPPFFPPVPTSPVGNPRKASCLPAPLRVHHAPSPASAAPGSHSPSAPHAVCPPFIGSSACAHPPAHTVRNGIETAAINRPPALRAVPSLGVLRHPPAGRAFPAQKTRHKRGQIKI